MKPLGEALPWDAGRHYSFAWICYITFTCAAVVMNGLSLYLISFNRKVRHINMVSMIWSLSFIDFIGSLACLILYAINYEHLEIFGHQMGCAGIAFVFSFFTLCQAWVLALTAYVAERSVCRNIELSNIQTMKLTIGAFVLSGLLTGMATFSAYGGYRVVSSGTFCFFKMTTPIGAGAFLFSVVVPTLIMSDRYFRIWRYLRTAQALLRRRGFKNTTAKAKNAAMSIKMALFMFTYMFCATPFLFAEIYELATDTYVSPAVQIVGAIMIHSSAVIYPILFLLLNKEIRAAVRTEFGFIFTPLLDIFCNRAAIRPEEAESDGPNDNEDLLSPTSAMIFGATGLLAKRKSTLSGIGEWQGWLEKPASWTIFETWCENNYVAENLLFYRDVDAYHKKAAELHGLFEFLLKQLEVSDEVRKTRYLTDEEIPKHAVTAWNELKEAAKQIYEIYIEAPTAPLEVNIPDRARRGIQQKLNISRGTSSFSSSAPISPGISLPKAAAGGSSSVAAVSNHVGSALGSAPQSIRRAITGERGGMTGSRSMTGLLPTVAEEGNIGGILPTPSGVGLAAMTIIPTHLRGHCRAGSINLSYENTPPQRALVSPSLWLQHQRQRSSRIFAPRDDTTNSSTPLRGGGGGGGGGVRLRRGSYDDSPSLRPGGAQMSAAVQGSNGSGAGEGVGGLKKCSYEDYSTPHSAFGSPRGGAAIAAGGVIVGGGGAGAIAAGGVIVGGGGAYTNLSVASQGGATRATRKGGSYEGYTTPQLAPGLVWPGRGTVGGGGIRVGSDDNDSCAALPQATTATSHGGPQVVTHAEPQLLRNRSSIAVGIRSLIHSRMQSVHEGSVHTPSLGGASESSVNSAAVRAQQALVLAVVNRFMKPKTGFPVLTSLPAEEILVVIDDISGVFDEALNVITNLINADIFPRFSKTAEYQTICAINGQASTPLMAAETNEQ